MTAPLTPQEAMIEIERAVMTAASPCERIRFHAYPDADRRLVLACAEFADGSEFQVLAQLDYPITVTADDYDEGAIARAFQMPSGAVH
jgi:hypothetical protein